MPAGCILRSRTRLSKKLPTVNRKSETTLLILTYVLSASIGLFDGLLGVAWPSMRASLGVSLDSVGLLFVAGTAGFLLSSFGSGRFITQGGLGRFLLISIILKSVGILGFALMPTWPGIIAASFVGGIGTGGIDTSTNTYVASNHSAGRMNWLHAGFGIGITGGPLLMTFILSAGQVWRWGYAITAAVELILMLAVLLTLGWWQIRPAAPKDGVSPEHARTWDTLRVPAVWLGIAIFLIYTGTETSGGQWSYTLFTEGRGVPETVAGLWVSIYWGTFTAGRFLIGFIADCMDRTLLLRLAMFGSATGVVLLWWNPAGWVSFGGLALLGFAFAPVFPTMIFTTAERLGSEHAPNAIGFQMGSASLGSAILPGLAGVFAERINLEVIGPFLLAGVVLMFLLHETLVVSTRKHALAGG